MFSRDELLAQARRRYPEFLRSLVQGVTFFPLELRIGKTRRAENYAERAAELAEFRAATTALGVAVEWRTVNDPRFGLHERPERALFADEAAFLGTLEKEEEVRGFRKDLALIRTECPVLETWILANVSAVIQHHGLWPALLRVVAWFRAYPRSGLYLRQLPVEGVDTKFFERYRAILDALLFEVQPETVDASTLRFEARHGLRWEEPLVRLRFLDPTLQAARGFNVSDLAVPAPTFRSLALGEVTAVVTENLRNFLALPSLPNAVAVWGCGDAAALLKGTPWLMQSRVLYWGDLDARGFAILSRLRAAYPAAESVMMNAATLAAHGRWTVKVESAHVDATGLTPDERNAFDQLTADNLRLEQERVPYDAVVEAFAQIMKLRRPASEG
jgi:hypothetical protein